MSCQAKLLFLAMAAMLSIRAAAARNRAAGSAPARFDKFDFPLRRAWRRLSTRYEYSKFC
jgi:hypothetical protein